MIAGEPLPKGDVSAAWLAHALASLSKPARAALSAAHSEAYHYGSDLLGSAHLLMGLLSDGGDTVTAALQERNGGAQAVKQLYERRYEGPPRPRPRIIHLPYSIHAKAVVTTAAGHADRQASPAGRAHLWCAITWATGSIAARLLGELGQLDYLRAHLLPALASPPDELPRY